MNDDEIAPEEDVAAPTEANSPEPEASSAESEVHIVEVEATPTAEIAGTVPMTEIGAFFDVAFTRLPAVLAAQGVEPIGPPFAFYAQPPTDTATVRVGFPVAMTIEAEGTVEPGSLPAGRVARYVHRGGFDGLGASWNRLMTWVGAHGLTPAGGFWEVYLVEPTPGMDPAELRTELDLPIR